MKKIKILFSFLIIFFPSRNIDKPCKGSNMVCKDDGRYLVFGSSSIYDNSKIKIFSLQGSDITFADYQPDRLVLNGYDSVMRFRISSKVDTLYIMLGSSDIDTISVSYGLSEGRCCSYNSIRTLNYNNSGALLNFNGTVEFKK